jgi:cell division protein FtsB
VIAGAFAVAGLCVLSVLRGPDGVAAILERHRRIRQLQAENAALQKEIQAKRERIERLRGSRSQQELEIRERLKLLKDKETTFIIQDEAKPEE